MTQLNTIMKLSGWMLRAYSAIASGSPCVCFLGRYYLFANSEKQLGGKTIGVHGRNCNDRTENANVV